MVSTHCTAVYSCSRRHKMHLLSVPPANVGCTWRRWVTVWNQVFTGAIDLRAVSEGKLEGAQENLIYKQKQK